MKNKLLAISMLAGALTFAGCSQSSSFSDLPSGRLAPSSRTRSDLAASSMDMGSGSSSGSTSVQPTSAGTSNSYRGLPSGRLAPSTRVRSDSPSS